MEMWQHERRGISKLGECSHTNEPLINHKQTQYKVSNSDAHGNRVK